MWYNEMCDAIWEKNMLDVAKTHFDECLEIVPILSRMMFQLLDII